MAVPLFNLAPNLTDSDSDSLALLLILKYKFILRAGTMTFGKQNTFPESFGLLDQAFLSGINFFDSTEMYPVVQRAQTQCQGRSKERRFGHQSCKVPSGQMTWIRDGPKCLNAKNITEAIVDRFAKANNCLAYSRAALLNPPRPPRRIKFFFAKQWRCLSSTSPPILPTLTLILWPSLSSSNTNSFFVGTMTFGEQNTFPESFGLVDQAFLSGINFFDSTEMYPVVQRAQTQGRSQERRFGHLGCKIPPGQMTWILDDPKCLNAKNITEAIDGSYVPMFGETEYDPTRYFCSIPIDKQLDALGRAVDSGKIRYGVMRFVQVAERGTHHPKIVSVLVVYLIIALSVKCLYCIVADFWTNTTYCLFHRTRTAWSVELLIHFQMLG
ncbi:unnamed protein product [Prunus brigantina]